MIISLIRRSVYGFTGLYASFLCLEYMPETVSVSLMQCTAFITSVIAYVLRGEPLSIIEVIVIILGLFGCIMLTNTDLF